MNETGIRWTTKTEYVDIDSGEVLTEKQARKYYTLMNKTKTVTINKTKTNGKITWTRQYRSRKQTELQFGDTK